MPFYIRKAFKAGPLRFNLSKSGIGVSAGVKGARIGLGPRGAYVHGGRGGIYFRERLSFTGAPGGSQSTTSMLALAPGAGSHAWVRVGESDDALVKELGVRRRRWPLWPWPLLPGGLGTLWLAESVAPIVPVYWTFPVMSAIGTIAICVVLANRDRRRRWLHLEYAVDTGTASVFAEFEAAFEHVMRCMRVTGVVATSEVEDTRRTAGASTIIQTRSIHVMRTTPSRVSTNAPMFLIQDRGRSMYLLPDRLLLWDPDAIKSIRVADLHIVADSIETLEFNGPPGDAEVIGHRWRFVNKDGSPDRRFRDNHQVPICRYGQLRLSATIGFGLTIQTSRVDAATQLCAALQRCAGLRVDAAQDDDPRDENIGLLVTRQRMGSGIQ